MKLDLTPGQMLTLAAIGGAAIVGWRAVRAAEGAAAAVGETVTDAQEGASIVVGDIADWLSGRRSLLDEATADIVTFTPHDP